MKKYFLLITFLLTMSVNVKSHVNQEPSETSICQSDNLVPEFLIGSITYFTSMPEFHYECTVSLGQYETIDMFNIPIASHFFVDPKGGKIEFTIDGETFKRSIYEPNKDKGHYDFRVPIRGYDYSGTGVPWPTISRIGIIRVMFAD